MSGFPVPLVCPRCREAVEESASAYSCGPCGATYPVVEGIPDFRVGPDPWIGIEDDRDKARRLAERTREAGFEDTVRHYWEMTPETPSERVRHFVDHVLRAERRSREWLREVEPTPAAATDAPWLDIGCGTADLASAAGSERIVVGVDVALRWLVAARKRLQESGVPAHLVCANAERLPFPEGRFSVALSLGTLEHCPDKLTVLEEARRALRQGGTLHFRTVNRYSLMPEAHVGLWGIGYLPRRWADAYVRWRTGQGYEHHHPVGGRALERLLERAGFGEVVVEAARSLAAETAALGGPARAAVPVYDALRGLPLVGRAVRLVAPLLEARGRAC